MLSRHVGLLSRNRLSNYIPTIARACFLWWQARDFRHFLWRICRGLFSLE